MNTGIRTNEQLTNIAQDAANLTRFREVKAHFTPFRDMKVKWTRSYSWIDFEVSDYLKGAPAEVLGAVMNTIVGRIEGQQTSYPQEVNDWVSSDEFVIRNQPTYIERCKNIGDHLGSEINLDMVYHNLIKRGLVEEDPMIHIGWGRESTGRHSGFSSVLMKTTCMNPILDDRELPWIILDYCLYAQLAHISMGFDPQTESRVDQYEALLNKYTFKDEAEKLMNEYDITL